MDKSLSLIVRHAKQNGFVEPSLLQFILRDVSRKQTRLELTYIVVLSQCSARLKACLLSLPLTATLRSTLCDITVEHRVGPSCVDDWKNMYVLMAWFSRSFLHALCVWLADVRARTLEHFWKHFRKTHKWFVELQYRFLWALFLDQ